MMQFLRNLLLHDFQLKLFSLVLAILTWIALSSIQQSSTTLGHQGPGTRQITLFNVPVTILSSKSDVQGFKVEPATVKVTVEGVPEILQNLKVNEIKVMVDVTGMEEGNGTRRRVEVSAPAGITLVQVIPSDVRVLFQSKL